MCTFFYKQKRQYEEYLLLLLTCTNKINIETLKFRGNLIDGGIIEDDEV